MINNDWRISDITWQHDGKAETLRGTNTKATSRELCWSG